MIGSLLNSVGRPLCCPALIVLLCFLPATLLAQAKNTTPVTPVVVLLDGSEIAVGSLQLANGQLTGKGLNGELSLNDVRQIRVRPRVGAQPPKPGIQVDLIGDGQLTAVSIAIADDFCTVGTSAAGKLKLPIDVVRCIAFDVAKLPPDYHKAVDTPSSEFDRLFFQIAEAAQGINGLIESLDDKHVNFEVDGETVTQPREKLLGIVVAQAIASGDLPPCTVTLGDGGSLSGELTAIADEKVRLKVGDQDVEIPWWSVRGIAVRSSKMAFLSDLKPTAAEQQSIVTLTRPWQRDRSYSGKPLQIGQRTFEKGIGAHARSLITYNLEGKYDEFAAVVGIDAATEGRGDCVMSVVADGHSLWSGRVRGVDPPQELNLKVAGVDELTLLVEPGEDLDLADHANWADARVIRSSK